MSVVLVERPALALRVAQGAAVMRRAPVVHRAARAAFRYGPMAAGACGAPTDRARRVTAGAHTRRTPRGPLRC
ncbi:hypothetical protein, partial [Streptomyces sp. NPDC002587]